jgi:phenylalanyl-tRNA synthetase beta chain
LGTIYDAQNRTEEGLPTENPELVIGMYGNADFYAIRGVVEALCKQAGISYTVAVSDAPYLHPGRQAYILHEGSPLAVVGEMHPDTANKFDLSGRVYVACVNLPLFFSLSQPLGEVKPIARFPAVNRDLALVMKETQQVGPLMEAIRTGCGAMLEDIRMFDVFRGIQIGIGNKSVAFSLTFRAADHTLTEEEITRLTEKALKISGEQFGAVLRA